MVMLHIIGLYQLYRALSNKLIPTNNADHSIYLKLLIKRTHTKQASHRQHASKNNFIYVTMSLTTHR